MDHATIRRKLAAWFDKNQRDLPWRRTRDPYAILVSEVMLQQTRVAVVIPYYERFLIRFPDAGTLAEAAEGEVLTMWAGLGYYSRARNLQKAAQQIAAAGAFPRAHAAIRELVGVGEYTAAAVASIAFGLPHASIDGNVRRVVTRLAGDADADVAIEAAGLVDKQDPGRSNQALMELGATICVPKEPRCADCPVQLYCRGLALGIQNQLPLPKVKPAVLRKERTLLLIRDRDCILLVPSPRVAGFWELPEPFAEAQLGAKVGTFRHAITNSQYTFFVQEARVMSSSTTKGQRGLAGVPTSLQYARWWLEEELKDIPLSTPTKKAFRCLEKLTDAGLKQ